jgi:ParB/RepB/Spo0J family partition protein
MNTISRRSQKRSDHNALLSADDRSLPGGFMSYTHQREFDLELIDPNHWQTREKEDTAHIEELAKSILSDGLQEVPAGRTNEDGSRVQLAFGHSRLAAYKLLAALGHEEYKQFPVNIRQYTDEQMAVIAFTENEKRSNLNPIERARAMQKMADNFHWTHAQIGEKLQLERASVSNAIRMLKLPAELQNLVSTEVIPVRSAMALLPFYELNEIQQDAVYEIDPEAQDFLALARQGQVNSDTIRSKVTGWLDTLFPVAEIATRANVETPLFAAVEEAEEPVQAAEEETNGPLFGEPTAEEAVEESEDICSNESDEISDAESEFVDQKIDTDESLTAELESAVEPEDAESDAIPEKKPAVIKAEPSEKKAVEPVVQEITKPLITISWDGVDESGAYPTYLGVVVGYREAGAMFPMMETIDAAGMAKIIFDVLPKLGIK